MEADKSQHLQKASWRHRALDFQVKVEGKKKTDIPSQRQEFLLPRG
jgi:hypothetical protein